MFESLLKKIIKNAAGRLKFIMATLGLLIAMTLILFAVQLQSNYQQLLYSKNNQDSITNFLVINKILNNQTIGNTSFSKAEIENFKQQNFISEVSVITPSTFKASIESSSTNFPFRTDISFESVPNSFIDLDTKYWHWNEHDDIVPIVAPNMFLDIYNFQFAASQGLPQLTPDIVKLITFNVNITTQNGVQTLKGKIVGFSNRISSLLVPQEFIDWGNKNNNQPTEINRIIVKTKDPGNPLLTRYLEKNGFATDTEKTRFSKYRKIVDAVVNISWITGAIMFLFALLIFSLFIQLTISSCQAEIGLLKTLGTRPKQLERFLMKQFIPTTLTITFSSLAIISILQYFAANYLASLNIFSSKMISVYTILGAVFIFILIFVMNKLTIRKYIYNT